MAAVRNPDDPAGWLENADAWAVAANVHSMNEPIEFMAG